MQDVYVNFKRPVHLAFSGEQNSKIYELISRDYYLNAIDNSVIKLTCLKLDETFVTLTRLESFQLMAGISAKHQESVSEKRVRAVDQSDAMSNHIQQLKKLVHSQASEMKRLKEETAGLR